MSAKAVVRMPGEGKQVSFAGKPLVFLVTGQDTRHTSMFDWTLPPGLPTGMHIHRVQEETFYVLEGACEWHVGGELIHAKPGTYVFIPPGVPHNIANASDKPARMIMTVSPPGARAIFRGAGEVGDAERAAGFSRDRQIAGTLRHRASVGAQGQLRLSR